MTGYKKIVSILEKHLVLQDGNTGLVIGKNDDLVNFLLKSRGIYLVREEDMDLDFIVALDFDQFELFYALNKLRNGCVALISTKDSTASPDELTESVNALDTYSAYYDAPFVVATKELKKVKNEIES